MDGFCMGFDKELKNVQILFMQSDGGLANMNNFSGHKAILSGPAGGYVGYAKLTKSAKLTNDNIQVLCDKIFNLNLI